MLPFANDDLTLFNKVEGINPITNKTFITWVKHFLTGCSWKKSLQALKVGNISIESNDILIQVPQSDLYVPFWEYYDLHFAQQESNFTGNLEDVLVLGHIPDNVGDIIAVNGVEKKKTILDIRQKYKGRCVVCKGFEDNAKATYPLKHYLFVGE